MGGPGKGLHPGFFQSSCGLTCRLCACRAKAEVRVEVHLHCSASVGSSVGHAKGTVVPVMCSESVTSGL